MRKTLIIATLATAFAASTAFAQQSGGVQRSTNPNGVQIQGNTNINAQAENTVTQAKGEGNKASTGVGAIRGGTQIQGNTNINAQAKNTTTQAVGKNNKASTDVGTIGGAK